MCYATRLRPSGGAVSWCKVPVNFLGFWTDTEMKRAFPPFLVPRVPSCPGRPETTYVYTRLAWGTRRTLIYRRGRAMPSILKTTRVYLDAQRRGVIACVQCGTHTPMRISPEAGAVSGKTVKVQCRV